MPSTKFTDRDLKLFYGNLLKHYQSCQARLYPDINAIYNEMYLATQNALESPLGSLNHLERPEKNKVYKAFNTIFYSLPIYTELSDLQRQTFNPQRPAYSHQVIYVYNGYNRYDFNDRLLFNWLLLSSITHDCRYHRIPSYPGNRHGHPNTEGGGSNRRRDHDKSSDLLALIALIMIFAAAFIGTVLALYFMLNEFLDSAERFYYNEGWLKAALMLATGVAFGAVSTMMSLKFALLPLITLALAAGLNPAGVLIVGLVCLTIMGAGLGALLSNIVFGYIDEAVNSDAMDASDSSRFQLTVKEEEMLTRLQVDPVKVRCAIVALRAEMSEVEKDNTGFLSRFSYFGKTSKYHELLSQVRKLRSGDISNVKVGDLTFDCRVDSHTSVLEPSISQAPNAHMQPIPVPTSAHSEEVDNTVPSYT